jgi:hypothetical protein
VGVYLRRGQRSDAPASGLRRVGPDLGGGLCQADEVLYLTDDEKNRRRTPVGILLDVTREFGVWSAGSLSAGAVIRPSSAERRLPAGQRPLDLRGDQGPLQVPGEPVLSTQSGNWPTARAAIQT